MMIRKQLPARLLGRVTNTIASQFRVLMVVGLASLTLSCDSKLSEAHFPERRLQLFSRLEQFSIESGFINHSSRFLKLAEDPDRNEDYPGLRLRVAPTCSIAAPELEIFQNSRLELGVGLGWVDQLVPDEGNPRPFPPAGASSYSARFKILWRPSSGAEPRLLAEHEVSLSPPASRAREPWTVELGDIVGERGEFLFEVERSAGPMDLLVLPDWWSPTLISSASKSELTAMTRERVLVDLLADSGEARVFQDDVLIGRVGEALPLVELGTLHGETEQPIQVPLVSIQSHFETGAGLNIRRGGVKPALAVAESCVIAWPATEIERQGEVEFRFKLGLDERVRAMQGVAIEVALQSGERDLERFEFSTAGQHFAEGWSQELRVPIDASHGALLELKLIVNLKAEGEPVRSVWPIPDQPGRAVDGIATLERPWVGIARPRLVASRELKSQGFGDAERPSVLILCAETLRADDLGPWGGTSTPQLNRLAQEGLRFERAYSPSSWTLPSVTSLLTGLDPGVHGAVSGESDQLADWCDTLPKSAHWNGVRTGAFISNSLIRRSAGFAGGFDTFVVSSSSNSRQLNRSFLDWLSEAPEQRFFAYVHYFDPHTPYNAPGEFREIAVEESLRGRPYDVDVKSVRNAKLGAERLHPQTEALRFLRGRYHGELQYLDKQVGALIDELKERGVLGNTLVAFVSDHGEEFGEHAWYGHGNNLYQESTRVPLILWGSGVESGVIEQPVETLGLSVLAASVLNLDALASKLQRRRPKLPLAPDEYVAAPIWMGSDKAVDFTGEWTTMLEQPERLEPHPIRALILGGKKAIFQFSEFPQQATLESVSAALISFELYDVERDAEDQQNLSSSFEYLPEDMKVPLLGRIEAELAAPRHMVDQSITAQMIDILDDLGYIDTDDDADDAE
ncbi:MAG: arylsulfatase A-like enzyme [Planctomycetota bacterium]|jgi:arylsulfatase A-like enzyme